MKMFFFGLMTGLVLIPFTAIMLIAAGGCAWIAVSEHTPWLFLFTAGYAWCAYDLSRFSYNSLIAIQNS